MSMKFEEFSKAMVKSAGLTTPTAARIKKLIIKEGGQYRQSVHDKIENKPISEEDLEKDEVEVTAPEPVQVAPPPPPPAPEPPPQVIAPEPPVVQVVQEPVVQQVVYEQPQQQIIQYVEAQPQYDYDFYYQQMQQQYAYDQYTQQQYAYDMYNQQIYGQHPNMYSGYYPPALPQYSHAQPQSEQSNGVLEEIKKELNALKSGLEEKKQEQKSEPVVVERIVEKVIEVPAQVTEEKKPVIIEHKEEEPDMFEGMFEGIEEIKQEKKKTEEETEKAINENVNEKIEVLEEIKEEVKKEMDKPKISPALKMLKDEEGEPVIVDAPKPEVDRDLDDILNNFDDGTTEIVYPAAASVAGTGDGELVDNFVQFLVSKADSEVSEKSKKSERKGLFGSWREEKTPEPPPPVPVMPEIEEKKFVHVIEDTPATCITEEDRGELEHALMEPIEDTDEDFVPGLEFVAQEGEEAQCSRAEEQEELREFEQSLIDENIDKRERKFLMKQLRKRRFYEVITHPINIRANDLATGEEREYDSTRDWHTARNIEENDAMYPDAPRNPTELEEKGGKRISDEEPEVIKYKKGKGDRHFDVVKGDALSTIDYEILEDGVKPKGREKKFNLRMNEEPKLPKTKKRGDFEVEIEEEPLFAVEENEDFMDEELEQPKPVRTRAPRKSKGQAANIVEMPAPPAGYNPYYPPQEVKPFDPNPPKKAKKPSKPREKKIGPKITARTTVQSD